MAISLGEAGDISGTSLPGQSVLANNSRSKDCANMSAYRPDYLFQTVIGVWEVIPVDCVKLKTIDSGIGKRSQVGLSLLEDIGSSTSGFCAILSGDLDAHEKSLSFTYGRPEKS